MLKKIVISLLSVILGFSLVGCGSNTDSRTNNDSTAVKNSATSIDVLSNKYTDLSKDEILKILDKEIQCETKEKSSAEFGVPGEITGINCVNDKESEMYIYMFRESPETDLINIWLSSWGFLPDKPRYIVKNKNWVLLLIDFSKNKLEKYDDIKIISLAEIENAYEDRLNEADVQCAEDVSAIIPDYVQNISDIPPIINKSLVQIIREDYDKYKSDVKKDSDEIIDDELYIKLSNASKRVNEYCKVHKDAYKQ